MNRINCRHVRATSLRAAVSALLVAAIPTIAQSNESTTVNTTTTITTKIPSAAEHLNPLEKKLNRAIELLLEAKSQLLRHNRAVIARSYLPAIADSDSKLMWEAAIFAAETDYERASQVLARVKHFEHGSFNCLKLAAKTNATQMKIDSAIQLCTLALARQKDERMYSLRGDSYLSQKKYVEAASDYIDAAGICYAALNFDRAANCFIRNKEPTKALIYADKSLQNAKEADLPTCYYCKGMCLIGLNHYKDAVAAFTNALKYDAKLSNKASDPRHDSYHVLAGNCLDERIKCYEKLGMIAEAELDRRQKADMVRKVEQELFGK